MTRTRAAKIAVVGVLGALCAAGAALAGVAYLVSSRRDVTTSSTEALRLYREARENEQKLYSRDAMTGYAAALQHDPQFFMAKVRLAAEVAGRDRERASSLLAGAARNREEVTARERLAWDSVDAAVRKDREAAARVADEFLARFPDEPEGYQLKAMLLEREGKLQEAIAQYERLLEVNPNFAVAYNTLGYYLMARGDHDRSEEYFKRYRFLAPDQANPYDSLGELYLATGRWDEAETSLKKALEVKPDFFAAHGHLGTLAVARGEWKEAGRHFARAREAAQDAKEAAGFRMAQVLSDLFAADFPAARQLLDEWEASIPPGAPPRDALELHVVRSIVLASEGRLAEARREAELVSLPAEPSAAASAEDRAGWSYLRSSLLSAIALREGRGGAAEVADARRPWPAEKGSAGGSGYFPGREAFRVFLAESLATAGRRGEAAEVLAEILAKSPRCRPALEARARLTGEATAALTLPSPGARPDAHLPPVP